jgi:hypothetical protein
MELFDVDEAVVFSSRVSALISNSHESIDYAGAHWDRYRIEFRLREAAPSGSRIDGDILFSVDKNCRAR